MAAAGGTDVHYARSGELSIAYQVVGEGPIDLVFVPFMISRIFSWLHPLSMASRWRSARRRTWATGQLDGLSLGGVFDTYVSFIRLCSPADPGGEGRRPK
jgi:hypothetical protein